MTGWLTAISKTAFALLLFPGFAFLFFWAMAFRWIDRRIIARLEGRIGPPWFQPLADFIKLMAKEDILPLGTDEAVATILPIISLAAVMTTSLYIPIANKTVISFEGDLIVVLFLLSIPALAYFIAGWISVGVYSVIGGNRALLQYFSYEVPFLITLSGPAILSGSWSISQIVHQQAQTVWGIFVQPLGFLLALIGLIGKLKRSPLDIPKAKSEIGAGPLTEFSGRKLALWYLTLHMQMVVGIFLLANLFLGGSSVGLVFVAKALLILLILSLASVLYARLRIDQLMNLGWRVLVPLALLQMMIIIWVGVG